MADSIGSVEDHYNSMTAQNNANRLASSRDTSLTMQDFLKLMVAQMQNQDMMNPMSDSEFMGQMAQYSMVQAISDMSAQNLSTYAMSMMGKEVTAAVVNKEGNLEKTVGVVTGVGLFQGSPVVYIGDKQFALGSIMVVGKMPEPKPPEGEGDGGDGGDGGGTDGGTGGSGDDGSTEKETTI